MFLAKLYILKVFVAFCFLLYTVLFIRLAPTSLLFVIFDDTNGIFL